jgi:hypothetical protein
MNIALKTQVGHDKNVMFKRFDGKFWGLKTRKRFVDEMIRVMIRPTMIPRVVPMIERIINSTMNKAKISLKEEPFNLSNSISLFLFSKK